MRRSTLCALLFIVGLARLLYITSFPFQSFMRDMKGVSCQGTSSTLNATAENRGQALVASEIRTEISRDRPYGDFCETEVLGEQQLWNPRKKVISYAIFPANNSGILPGWIFNGFKANVELARLYYPDWVLRMHTFGLSNATIQELFDVSENSVEIVRCHDDTGALLSLSNSRKMIPRFLSYDDPSVFYTIVRDLDSRFSPRELMAVNEWIGSGLGFHTMRDHAYHTIPVMGGMFGIARGALGSTKMTSLVKQALEEFGSRRMPGCCGEDQNFLGRFVWPIAKSTAIDHDINPQRCKRYGSKVCRPFPLEGRDESNEFFVGAAFKGKNADSIKASKYDCSLQCVHA